MALIIWLSPKIAEFQALYPSVGIKFITAIWEDSADNQLFDIDILLLPDGHASKHMEKLSTEFLIPIISSSHAEQITSAQELASLNPIHILGYDDHWSRYLAAFNFQHDVRSTKLQVGRL
jgi:LysR family glycine cleavage system transcriptional activator